MCTLTLVRLRRVLVAGQLLYLLAGEAARLGLAESLGEREERLVVLGLGRLAGVLAGLRVRRYGEHRQEVQEHLIDR